MLEYIHRQNIDDRVLKRAVRVLRDGGLVAFPTDTSWSVACDIKSRAGVEKLRKLKNTNDFTPTVMTTGFTQWNEYVDLDNRAYRLVKDYAPGPFVFVFPAKPHLKNHLGPKRLEVGLRIPDHPVPLALVSALFLGEALVICLTKMPATHWLLLGQGPLLVQV